LEEVAFQHPVNASRAVLLQGGQLALAAYIHTVTAQEILLASAAPDEKRTQITIDFRTSTRLKHEGKFVEAAPPFHVLIRTLLRRLSSLSYFHGGQRWETDYRGWIAQAEQVQIAQADVQWVDWERYSTRQQRKMNLGGIVGSVTYTGQLSSFMPLLHLGELVHVGKGAVFGNGQYRILVDEAEKSS
jgi:hypothetical protein